LARGWPPLCVLPGFRYPLERLQLRPGDRLCLITDGVTEAQNLRGEFYGSARLLEALTETTAATDLELQAEALLQDLAAFSGPAEPADDAALLLLRWQP
jgi:adenylate cyclase